MAAGMDFSPPFTILEGAQGSYSNKGNACIMEDEKSNDLNKVKQSTTGRPPRNLSILRHSISSIRLQAATDLVSSLSLVC